MIDFVFREPKKIIIVSRTIDVIYSSFYHEIRPRDEFEKR